MNVRELMTTDPEACTPQDTLDVAGQIPRRRRCGFVPVVDSQTTQRVIGVLTDRDIALYLTQTHAWATGVKIEACMTKEPKTVAPEAELEEAAHPLPEGHRPSSSQGMGGYRTALGRTADSRHHRGHCGRASAG